MREHKVVVEVNKFGVGYRTTQLNTVNGTLSGFRALSDPHNTSPDPLLDAYLWASQRGFQMSREVSDYGVMHARPHVPEPCEKCLHYVCTCRKRK